MKLLTRDVPPRAAWQLEQHGAPPLLARLWAARGVTNPADMDDALEQLLPPHTLLGLEAAAQLLAHAVQTQRRVCVVADYDCDGATACAVAVRGLQLLGLSADYLVPDRLVDGYGLTPGIAQRVADTGADILMTVDNGIASLDGVAHANALGLQCVITDHHLPALVQGQVQLPEAAAIVNPNQPNCGFASKALAGVGVMFYVLLATRAALRAAGHFGNGEQPRLDSLLPLVALGTVADVVPLDSNNRRLVAQGLRRLQRGGAPPGMLALLQVAGKAASDVRTEDLGFVLGPRINAAGRLADMRVGIACLLTQDASQAAAHAAELEAINRSRRSIEGDMRQQAMELAQRAIDQHPTGANPLPSALCIFDPSFHEGVVGIVAGRVKDHWHRPTFVFARNHQDPSGPMLKGSGRSVPGFHLRDALDAVVKRHPNLLSRFGGHAMAAGCTLPEHALPAFAQAFEQIATEWLGPTPAERSLLTDGALPADSLTVETARQLRDAVWGQGFAAPVFCNEVAVLRQKLVGQGHTLLSVTLHNQRLDAIWFGHTDPLPARVQLAYRLELDTWQGNERLRLHVEHASALQ